MAWTKGRLTRTIVSGPQSKLETRSFQYIGIVFSTRIPQIVELSYKGITGKIQYNMNVEQKKLERTWKDNSY